jgi:hypothetical protein
MFYAPAGVAATTAITLGALAGLAVILSLHGASQRSELISISASKSSGFKPYKGQMLFTLNDFASGRVEYPSQNLANGPGNFSSFCSLCYMYACRYLCVSICPSVSANTHSHTHTHTHVLTTRTHTVRACLATSCLSQ